MSAQKAIRYSMNLASEFQPPPPLFFWMNETHTTRLSVCWKSKFKQGKAVPPRLFLSIWCRGKRPRGRALVILFTVPYFPIRPSRLSALPWWRRASGFIGGSGREITLRAESPSIFLESIGNMKESPSSVICHTVISSLQLAFQEARPSSNASIRLVIRQ